MDSKKIQITYIIRTRLITFLENNLISLTQ